LTVWENGFGKLVIWNIEGSGKWVLGKLDIWGHGFWKNEFGKLYGNWRIDSSVKQFPCIIVIAFVQHDVSE